MNDIIVEKLGIDTNHAPQVWIERPQGLSVWLIMCFRTPFTCKTHNGKEEGKPGDCVINSPGTPHWHGPRKKDKTGFRNDWIHLYGTGVDALLHSFDIPQNQIIPGHNPNLLFTSLSEIENELMAQEYCWKHMARLKSSELLLHISRMCKRNQAIGTNKSNIPHLEKILHTRAIVRAQFRENWTVAKMAEMAELSSNRFSILYKNIFCSSPIDDLIEQRMNHAKYLLDGTAMSISGIASSCGYEDLYYFCRLFRTRFGTSPTKYRKKSS